MAFTPATDPFMQAPGSGEILSGAKFDMSFSSFEDGLLAGRVAQLKDDSVDATIKVASNIDGTATPKVLGVVHRRESNAIEDNATYTNKNTINVDIRLKGTITVDVVAGQTPVFLDAAYFINDKTDDAGKVTTDKGKEKLGNSFFISEARENVWLVYVDVQPKDAVAALEKASASEPSTEPTKSDAAEKTVEEKTKEPTEEAASETEPKQLQDEKRKPRF